LRPRGAGFIQHTSTTTYCGKIKEENDSGKRGPLAAEFFAKVFERGYLA